MTLHYSIFDLFTKNSLIQENELVKANSAKEAVTKYLDGKNINYTLKRGTGDNINIKATPFVVDEMGNKFDNIKKRCVWFYAEKKEKGNQEILKK